jgi:hypothetical protein
VAKLTASAAPFHTTNDISRAGTPTDSVLDKFVFKSLTIPWLLRANKIRTYVLLQAGIMPMCLLGSEKINTKVQQLYS